MMKILTANRLSDGEVVWLAADHSWTIDIADAAIAGDAVAEEKLLRAGTAAFLKNEVLDVDLIDIELVDGTIRPLRLRERIRATGPTSLAETARKRAGGFPVAA